MALGQVARFVIIFGQQIVLARLLTPNDFGVIAAVSPILGFVAILANLGVTQAIIQRPHIDHGILNSVFWTNVIFGGILTGFFCLLSPILAHIYRDPRLIPISISLSMLILITSITQVHTALMNRQFRFGALTLCEIASLILGAAAAIVSARYFHIGYWSLVINQVVVSLSSSAMLLSMSPWSPRLKINIDARSSIIGFSAKVTVSNLITYLSTSIDNMIVGVARGEFDLGIYDRAWKLAVQPLLQLTAPIGKLAVPILARTVGDAQRYARLYRQMFQSLMAMTAPAILLMVFYAEPLVALLFGPKWLNTIPVFRWISVSAIATPVVSGCSWIFISQGRANDQIKATAIMMVVSTVAYAVGAMWSVQMVAVLYATSLYLIQVPANILIAGRSGDVPSTMLLRSLGPCCASALACAGAYHKLRPLHVGPLPIDLGLKLLCGYLAYGAALLLFRDGRGLLTLYGEILLRKQRG